MSDSTDAKATRLMLAYLCIANEAEANVSRKVQILGRFGLQDSEIAQVCGVAAQSVRNARAKVTKRSKSGKKKKK
jgi:hypothetical protein